MLPLLRAWLKSQLSQLNPHAVRVTLAILGTALTLELAVEGLEYGTAWLARRHGLGQHRQAVTKHLASQATGQAATTRYQIDSATRATQRVALLRQDSLLATQDRDLSTTRPARLPLPAAEHLPHEGTN